MMRINIRNIISLIIIIGLFPVAVLGIGTVPSDLSAEFPEGAWISGKMASPVGSVQNSLSFGENREGLLRRLANSLSLIPTVSAQDDCTNSTQCYGCCLDTCEEGFFHDLNCPNFSAYTYCDSIDICVKGTCIDYSGIVSQCIAGATYKDCIDGSHKTEFVVNKTPSQIWSCGNSNCSKIGTDYWCADLGAWRLECQGNGTYIQTEAPCDKDGNGYCVRCGEQPVEADPCSKYGEEYWCATRTQWLDECQSRGKILTGTECGTSWSGMGHCVTCQEPNATDPTYSCLKYGDEYWCGSDADWKGQCQGKGTILKDTSCGSSAVRKYCMTCVSKNQSNVTYSCDKYGDEYWCGTRELWYDECQGQGEVLTQIRCGDYPEGTGYCVTCQVKNQTNATDTCKRYGSGYWCGTEADWKGQCQGQGEVLRQTRCSKFPGDTGYCVTCGVKNQTNATDTCDKYGKEFWCGTVRDGENECKGKIKVIEGSRCGPGGETCLSCSPCSSFKEEECLADPGCFPEYKTAAKSDKKTFTGCIDCKASKEICDKKDNDCDGKVDEDGVCDKQLSCKDLKEKECKKRTFCAPIYTEKAGRKGYTKVFSSCQECDNIPESCDGRDNDCDGEIDEGGVCEYASSCNGLTEDRCLGATGCEPTYFNRPAGLIYHSCQKP